MSEQSNLFTRSGAPYTGAYHTTAKGAPFIQERKSCSRCGGAGGSSKWAHTGWTCYDCGGSGKGGLATIKLYTAEKLAKLDATAAKRAAVKAAQAAARAAQEQAAAEARRQAFEATYGPLLASAEPYLDRSEFIADVVRKAGERAELSEGQAVALEAAIARFQASDAKKAASGYVGKPGERITITVTAERMAWFDTQYGVTYVATMRDAAGNAIVSKGRFIPPTVTRNHETERWEIGTAPFTIKATVKEHSSFRDEKQTIVQRVAELATK